MKCFKIEWFNKEDECLNKKYVEVENQAQVEQIALNPMMIIDEISYFVITEMSEVTENIHRKERYKLTYKFDTADVNEICYLENWMDGLSQAEYARWLCRFEEEFDINMIEAAVACIIDSTSELTSCDATDITEKLLLNAEVSMSTV